MRPATGDDLISGTTRIVAISKCAKLVGMVFKCAIRKGDRWHNAVTVAIPGFGATVIYPHPAFPASVHASEVFSLHVVEPDDVIDYTKSVKFVDMLGVEAVVGDNIVFLSDNKLSFGVVSQFEQTAMRVKRIKPSKKEVSVTMMGKFLVFRGADMLSSLAILTKMQSIK